MCRDDDGCEFGSQEERDCNTLGSDWGDPFGMVVEDAQGRCAPPWGVSSDRKRRFGRWGAKRPVLRRIEKCGSDESRCSIVVDVAAEHVMPLGVDGAWAKHAPQRILSHDTEWIGKGIFFIAHANLAFFTDKMQR